MTDANETQSTAPRRRLWPRVLLVASLTLNVLVLSVVAGALFRDGRDDRRSPPPDRAMLREGGFMPFLDAMPREARMRTAQAFREGGGGMQPDRAALAADFRDLVAALRTEPFDPTALETVLEAQHARAAARVTAGRGILVGQINGMSADERAAFADALEARFRDALARAPGAGRNPDH